MCRQRVTEVRVAGTLRAHIIGTIAQFVFRLWKNFPGFGFLADAINNEKLTLPNDILAHYPDNDLSMRWVLSLASAVGSCNRGRHLNFCIVTFRFCCCRYYYHYCRMNEIKERKELAGTLELNTTHNQTASKGERDARYYVLG